MKKTFIAILSMATIASCTMGSQERKLVLSRTEMRNDSTFSVSLTYDSLSKRTSYDSVVRVRNLGNAANYIVYQIHTNK